MKVSLARGLKESDIVIGSLHEIRAAGISPTAEMQRILSRPSAIATTAVAMIAGRSFYESQNIALKRQFLSMLGSDPPHPSAVNARKFLHECWDQYKKVCFVRNPYEQIASDYFFLRRVSGRNFSFQDFVSAQEDPAVNTSLNTNRVTNWEMISIDNALAVDFVGRYENLSSDFQKMTRFLGLSDLELGHEKKSQLNRDSEYGALYDEKTFRRVERLFKSEIEVFGYEFPY